MDKKFDLSTIRLDDTGRVQLGNEKLEGMAYQGDLSGGANFDNCIVPGMNTDACPYNFSCTNWFLCDNEYNWTSCINDTHCNNTGNDQCSNRQDCENTSNGHDCTTP